MIRIDINLAAVQQEFSELQRRLADMSPAMREIAGVMADAVEESFAEERDPTTGNPWEPLQPSTIGRRESAGYWPGSILQQTGQLAASIQSDAGPDFALVGTNKIYAGTQQFGAKKGEFGATSRGAAIPWGNIPARPVFGLDDESIDEIDDVMRRYLTP